MAHFILYFPNENLYNRGIVEFGNFRILSFEEPEKLEQPKQPEQLLKYYLLTQSLPPIDEKRSTP